MIHPSPFRPPEPPEGFPRVGARPPEFLRAASTERSRRRTSLDSLDKPKEDTGGFQELFCSAFGWISEGCDMLTRGMWVQDWTVSLVDSRRTNMDQKRCQQDVGRGANECFFEQPSHLMVFIFPAARPYDTLGVQDLLRIVFHGLSVIRKRHVLYFGGCKMESKWTVGNGCARTSPQTLSQPFNQWSTVGQ